MRTPPRADADKRDPNVRDVGARALRADSIAAAVAERRRLWSPWIWAWIAGSTLALVVALSLVFPTRDRWLETCVVCESQQRRSESSGALGLLKWDRLSEVWDSPLVTDGLVTPGHVHRWSTLSHSSHGLFGRSKGDGGRSAGQFAHRYSYEPAFRREVEERLARGSLSVEQIRRELERDWSDPKDPGRFAIAELIKQFDRPPTRVR